MAAGPGDPAAFRFVGGRLCLDFVATLGRRHGTPVERLADRAALGRWIRQAGLHTPAGTAIRVTAVDLTEARELREALYGLVRAALDGRAPRRADLAAVNRLAARPDLVPQLSTGAPDPDRSDRPGVSWHGGRQAGAALATLARDGVLLLGSPLVTRVKECQNPACSLLFLDDSQARRRRWCSMERCGNLAKIAGYRSRARRTGTRAEGGD